MKPSQTEPKTKIENARDGLVQYGVYAAHELAAMSRHRVLRAWARFHAARAQARRGHAA